MAVPTPQLRVCRSHGTLNSRWQQWAVCRDAAPGTGSWTHKQHSSACLCPLRPSHKKFAPSPGTRTLSNSPTQALLDGVCSRARVHPSSFFDLRSELTFPFELNLGLILLAKATPLGRTLVETHWHFLPLVSSSVVYFSPYNSDFVFLF